MENIGNGSNNPKTDYICLLPSIAYQNMRLRYSFMFDFETLYRKLTKRAPVCATINGENWFIYAICKEENETFLFLVSKETGFINIVDSENVIYNPAELMDAVSYAKKAIKDEIIQIPDSVYCNKIRCPIRNT